MRLLKITLLRKDRGLSQAALARLARISPSDLSRIESGRTRPYPSQVKKITEALGVSEGEGERLFDEVQVLR